MDRVVVFPGAIPQDTDLLNTNKNVMLALGYALRAVLGTQTLADGLSCAATVPAGMTVNVSPGSIYSLAEVDASAYGSLAADTADLIVKQGISPSTTNFSCPAPAGVGQSVVYLIQAAYQDSDGGATVLPYYNASNPSVPYSGPNNSGASNFTARQGKCVLSLKTGSAAATGSQVAPTPDAGYSGLWEVTVANGQTSITGANISQHAGAPFVGLKLPALNAFATQSLAPAGYQMLPGGLLLQWMQVALTASVGPTNGFYGGQDTFSFPVAFPNAYLFGVASPVNLPGVEGGAGLSAPTAANVQVSVQNTTPGSAPVNVLAIGY